ncbi:MAG: hypothetical protein K1X83_05170 [Oligoflexia bacterium]|nr:hypothetical protein [Oligoflexia bacterium]
MLRYSAGRVSFLGYLVVRANDFKTHSIRLAIFSSTPGAISQAKILQPLVSEYSNILDGGITAVPVPPDAPPEIPRVILMSKSREWRVQGSSDRLDCFWTLPQGMNASVKPTALDTGVQMISHVVEKSNIRVGRCAVVFVRLLEHQSPGEELSRYFCNEAAKSGPLKRSENFEIHNHKVYELIDSNSAIKINSWVRCKTGGTVSGNKRVIIVEQDLNTLGEELKSRNFTSGSLKGFFKAAAKEADSILELYFPSR